MTTSPCQDGRVLHTITNLFKQLYSENLEEEHEKKEAALQIGANPKPTGCGPNQLLCELCDVTFTSTDAYTAHIQGSEHQKVSELHTKLESIPSTDPVVVSTTTTSPSVFKIATNTDQTRPATKPLAKPVTPVAAEHVHLQPEATFVDTMQTIESPGACASIQYGAISVQTGHGDTVALLKELVEQGDANVFVQFGETNQVETVTNIIQEDTKLHRLL
ncbi:hypothetical protein ScPMuIL_016420, partial [Solemya velum]